jgi:CRISPR-associated protein Cmr6
MANKPTLKGNKKPLSPPSSPSSHKLEDKKIVNATPLPPNHWLHDQSINPDPTASFVEYLRWMRPYSDDSYREGTKLQIMQQAVDNANYSDRLKLLSDRTKLMAGEGNYFQVKSTWRIRVGGHRGPESILIPAFDALGMPYIPSATLRGIARNQAIIEMTKTKKLSWSAAEKAIAPYFGSLETDNKADQGGKVVFLDAYPLPSKNGGLALDMANNIWQWDGNQVKYSPNPNTFYSLQETTFIVGIRLVSTCKDDQILKQVKQWLVTGLRDGIGAQVNSGYGQLITAGNNQQTTPIIKLEFDIEGQLIHGYQKFERWHWNDRINNYQVRATPQAEVRTTAFKSMLRYWFRVISLGVLTPSKVKEWEATLFGAIEPQSYGWVKFNLIDGKVVNQEPGKQGGKVGKQSGTLLLDYNKSSPESQHQAIAKLFKNLTWLMLNLGGVGQGARRPCYSRNNRPYHRGCTIFIDTEEDFWFLAETAKSTAALYKKRFQDFYSSLQQLMGETCDGQNRKTLNTPTQDTWSEVIDSHCRIILCEGNSSNHKPFALSVLHDNELKRNGDYDGFLCGTVRGGQVKPSPIWIVDGDDYQIVTIFGATVDPRKRYLQKLQEQSQNIYIIM